MASASLRPLVLAGVEPFARRFVGREQDAAQMLVEIIVGLSNYSEEGLAYSPLVFLADDLSATLSTLRGTDPIVMGKEAHAGTAARMALRNCAPLGEGRRWAVFVRLVPQGVEYGLFRPESSPLKPTSFEILRRTHRQGAPVVGLTQLRAGVVEVRGADGRGEYFDFSGSPEEARTPGYVVQEFVEAVTSAAADPVRAQLRAFYYRITVEILTGNHGALAVVLPAGAAPPAFLQDGIWLQPPVDLVPWIARDDADATSDAARALFAFAQLIRRMTMMDGVTVFGADGTVRAYGCFLREAGLASPSVHVVGGARQRAYASLRAQVGEALVAALYRSQDGAADCLTGKAG